MLNFASQNIGKDIVKIGLTIMEIILFTTIILLLIASFVFFLFLYRYYEKRLAKAIRHAQRSEQLKSVFLSNVSRALRTPLNAILGYTELILDGNDESLHPSQIKEMTANIHHNSEQALSFISQLLDLSNFEGSMPSFTLIEVNLAELMASYRRESLVVTKPDVSVRVRTDLSPHCKVTIDTNFMHQLMMHLLTNAAKHTNQGDINIYYEDYRKGLKVTISYQGNGQAELIGEDIFSFLQREDALTVDKDSSGLTISICKAIIDALDGELDIYIENGIKTIASFWFPCKMVDKHKE